MKSIDLARKDLKRYLNVLNTMSIHQVIAYKIIESYV